MKLLKMTLIASAGFLLPCASSIATLVAPVNRSQLVREASLVVWGEIVQIEVSPQGYRNAILEAKEVVRAPESMAHLRDFRIILENRYIDREDVVERVASAPELRLNENFLLFLDPVDASSHPLRIGPSVNHLFSLRGFFQGAYRVFEDKQGIKRIVAWNEYSSAPVSDAELKAQKMSGRSKAIYRFAKLPLQFSDTREVPTLNALLDEVRAVSGPSR